jgi:hypothetical protein
MPLVAEAQAYQNKKQEKQRHDIPHEESPERSVTR